MKLFHIHVKEEQSEVRSNSKYTEVDLKIFEELPKKNHVYVMNEYSRGPQKQLLRIGVEALDASKVSVATKDLKIELVQSVKKPGVWYDQANLWIEDGYLVRSESCFGINACGKWEVTAFDKNDQPYEKVTVTIIPSLLDFQKYEIMQLEVKSLFEALAYNQTEVSDLGHLRETQMTLYPVEKLKSLLNELNLWLNKISESPAEQLLHTREKVARSLIKRWDSHSLVEKTIFPFREKLSVRETVKNTDLIEHRMIRGLLDVVKNRILQEQAVEKSMSSQMKKDISNRLQSLTSDFNPLRREMESRCELIQKDINTLLEREKEWGYCLAVVQTNLEEPIFQVHSMEIEFTHLFSSEPSYMATFDLFEEIESLIPKMKSNEREFVEAMMNSPHLYEVWMLLQLIHQLRKLQFNCVDVWNSLIEKYTNDKSIKGWKCRIHSLQNEGECWIYYEPEIPQENNKSLKPDYLLIYRTTREDVWQGHTIDAKYKPYTNLSSGLLERDLEHSCRRYSQKIKLKNVIMKSGSLVHIDEKTTHWNIENDSLYKTSHFSSIPGNLENLKIYMARLLHYFFQLENLCPSCGSPAKIVDAGFKRTYICPKDNEVWVSTVCKHKGAYHPNYPVNLLKYASHNYNVQVQNRWDVHCPICRRNYPGEIIKMDLFGNRLSPDF